MVAIPSVMKMLGKFSAVRIQEERIKDSACDQQQELFRLLPKLF